MCKVCVVVNLSLNTVHMMKDCAEIERNGSSKQEQLQVSLYW